jgi:hypothetical protein
MNESNHDQTLNILEQRTKRIEAKLDESILELRTAAMFLVVLNIGLTASSVYIAVIVAVAVSSIFAVVNSYRLRKYGTF